MHFMNALAREMRHLFFVQYRILKFQTVVPDLPLLRRDLLFGKPSV